MRIEKSNILSYEEKVEVYDLETICFKEEGLKNHAFLSNEINFNKLVPCFYRGYEGNKLVAFLTTFMPSSEEAEVLAVTHPDFRNRGCFKKLFHKAKEVLLSVGIKKIIFGAESKSKSALKVLNTLSNISLNYSEYRMSCSKPVKAQGNKLLKLEEISKKNKDDFLTILSEAFSDEEVSERFLDEEIHDDNRTGYAAYYNNNLVGVFNFDFVDGLVLLYGVAIKKEYRGIGLGKELVRIAINEGLKKCKEIVLEVDSKNIAAFNLYKTMGFNIDFQVDYYNYSLL